MLNLFSFPFLEALQASLSGLILHAGQTAGKGRKGKENGQGFNGIPNPTGTARRGLKGHLRFAEGCRKIHEPVSGAVLDARTTAVPLHGKISPAGIAGRMAGEWGYKGNSPTECIKVRDSGLKKEDLATRRAWGTTGRRKIKAPETCFTGSGVYSGIGAAD